MIKNGKRTLGLTISTKHIDEDDLKELVQDIIFSNSLEETYSETDLKFHLMSKTKCDVKYLQHLFEKIKLCGLNLCVKKVEKSRTYGTSTVYKYYDEFDLIKFASLRGYIAESEYVKIIKKFPKAK